MSMFIGREIENPMKALKAYLKLHYKDNNSDNNGGDKVNNEVSDVEEEDDDDDYEDTYNDFFNLKAAFVEALSVSLTKQPTNPLHISIELLALKVSNCSMLYAYDGYDNSRFFIVCKYIGKEIILSNGKRYFDRDAGDVIAVTTQLSSLSSLPSFEESQLFSNVCNDLHVSFIEDTGDSLPHLVACIVPHIQCGC